MSGPAATIFGIDPFWLSSALLFITYGVLVIDRLNRSIVALLGGGLMIACGLVDQNQAIAGQDFNTLALLIGMMLLVAIARPSGMFQYLAFWSVRRARGRPDLLLALLGLVTAVVSAFLDNVTTVLLIVPVTLRFPAKKPLPSASTVNCCFDESPEGPLNKPCRRHTRRKVAAILSKSCHTHVRG